MKRIVILGGGFGGLTAAQQLEKRCQHQGECEVILINKTSEHLYTPLLYEAATGFLEGYSKKQSSRLQSGASVRLNKLQCIRKKRIQLIHGAVVSVDPNAQTVLLEKGREISYDYLVVALGSEPNYYGIPGLEENAIPLKWYENAVEIRGRLLELLKACMSGKRDYFTVIVIGAGPGGVEYAAELANYYRKLERRHRLQLGSMRVELLDARSEILPMLPRSYRLIAMRRLQRLGVRVIPGTFVTGVEEGKVHAAPNDKAGNSPFTEDITLESHLLIWSGGIKPNRVVQKFGLPLTKHGAIEVDSALRVIGFTNIFAIGDCAAVHDSVQHKLIPQLAHAAIEQGELVTDNILRDMNGEGLREVQGREHWTTIVPLGGRYAVTQISGIVIKGIPAYVLGRFVDLRYFSHILPWSKAWMVWFRGVHTFLKND
ncbi:MAG: NAD(P)/FAD-dependent oxidoreductase [bacterium]|nr:NAD(P)/FAD-dependent oxidoreductase [bacterium]